MEQQISPSQPSRFSFKMRLPKDARVYQILFLGALLTTGAWLRDFSVHLEQIALTFCAGLVTQAFFIHRLGLQQRGYLSAIVTCLGLSILLRADSFWVHPLIATLAISSKFLIRFNSKHLYNPANLGVILALLFLPGAWVSPGQWGNDFIYAAWFLALGATVTNRARRADISWMFLSCYLGLIALRVLWLEQSWTILFHQLQSGALLLFTFFMISDPMTIPNHIRLRLLYAAIVALFAFIWQFVLFKPNGLIWALFFMTPLVPLLDKFMPAPKFSWRESTPSNVSLPSKTSTAL